VKAASPRAHRGVCAEQPAKVVGMSNRSKELYMESVTNSLLKTREGKIVIWGSVINVLLGALTKLAPDMSPLTQLTGTFCLWIPLILVIFFVKGRLLKPRASNWFDSGLLILVAALPVIMQLYVTSKT
jgi:hypothetical protein